MTASSVEHCFMPEDHEIALSTVSMETAQPFKAGLRGQTISDLATSPVLVAGLQRRR